MSAETKNNAINQSNDAIKAVYGIPLEVSMVLGRKKLKVEQILDLKPGMILELDKSVGDPVEVHINGKIVAMGEVVVVGDKIGVTLTAIVDSDII